MRVRSSEKSRRSTKRSGRLDLLERFIASRSPGISQGTIDFYRYHLTPFLRDWQLTPDGIAGFLAQLTAGNGRHSYYRCIRALCRWAYRRGFLKTNVIEMVEAPKVTRPILPSLSEREVKRIIADASGIRNKAIIALYVKSGLRLADLARLNVEDIDLATLSLTAWCKGGTQRRAVYDRFAGRLLKRWLEVRPPGAKNLWGIGKWGIVSMLRRLRLRTGLPANAHTYRRTFACELHRRGMDVEHIMRLGGWADISMVVRYTRSVKFEDSERLYRKMNGEPHDSR